MPACGRDVGTKIPSQWITVTLLRSQRLRRKPSVERGRPWRHNLPDGGRVRIMLGGLASDSLEEAWHWTGADLAARDAPEALAAT